MSPRSRTAPAPFVHEQPEVRVVSGPGTVAAVPEELARLGLRRVLVIAGGSAGPAGDRLATRLGSGAARFGTVAAHVPEALAAEATAAATGHRADGLCCVGGGAATGLAKAVAATCARRGVDLPIVAVPTTYAGSEATATYGLTGERKVVRSDPRVRPRTVVYDPELSTGLPARATATSAFNALAHAVAALAGPGYDPVARLYASEAIGLIRAALPVAVREPADLDARGRLLWAAWLAGGSLAGAAGGAHHKLCHALGGRHRLVHAEVHTVLLPHTAERDEALTAPGRRAAAAALGADSVPAGLQALAAAAGHLPRSLAELGVPAGGLDPAAAEAATTVGRDHPRYGDAAWFRALLEAAHHPPQG